MAAGFLMNTEDATRLMAELQATHAVLIADAKRETLAAARKMRDTARELAVSPHMPSLRNSIDTRTKQFVTGIEVTVEAKSPFGYGREFGFGRNTPKPFMGPALEQHLAPWEQALSAALSRTL